eukprot:UN20574
MLAICLLFDLSLCTLKRCGSKDSFHAMAVLLRERPDVVSFPLLFLFIPEIFRSEQTELVVLEQFPKITGA